MPSALALQVSAMRVLPFAVALLALVVAFPAASAAKVTLTIEAGTRADSSMYFTPSTATANQGDDVTLTVHNGDTIFHDFALLDYNGRDIEIELDPQETGTKNFTAALAGTFEYICEVTGHKDRGMKGTLTIQQAANGGGKPAPGFELVFALVGAAAAALVLSRRPPRRGRVAPMGALLVGASLLAGCASSPTTPPSPPASPPGGPPSTAPYDTAFEGDAVGAAPAGWTVSSGTWRVVENASSPAGARVLQATNTGEGFPLIIAPAGAYRDFDASVRFAVLGGHDSQSAGIAFRHKDDPNYDVVRINLLEANMRLFKYVNGGRSGVGTGGAALAQLGTWHEMRITARGAEIVAYLDDQRVFEVEEGSNLIGGVGLWTKDDSTTQFDDFAVTPK